MSEIVYLAYGSNLRPLRLRQRVPSCRVVGVVDRPGFRLAFHKVGMDGSGKCDLVETGDPEDRAWGVLYSIAASEKPDLDVAEGPGYACLQRTISYRQQPLEVMTYLARPERRDPSQVPFDWYRELVLLGARHHNLPQSYIGIIEAVTVSEDPDPERAVQHHRLIEEIRVFGDEPG